MKNIIAVFITLSFYGCNGQDHNGKNQAQESASDTIIVYTDEEIHPVRDNFWGTNLLFWMDDDASLAKNEIEGGLKEIKIKLLRYPGGTVADNFHWKTNTLENTNMFPFEDGEAQTDFDEFIQICRNVGAEPSVVVNTESWAVKGDITGGAHEAANWLRYCKEKGYKVKIWEIGNETYWHPVISAREYAGIVNIYADSLKKIDPNVIIAVNGHWDINFVGTKERIKKEAYDQLMTYRRNINSVEDAGKYKAFRDDNKILPITTGDKKWWPTLAEYCGHNIDMIVVHWYFGANQLATMSEKLLGVRELLVNRHPGKSFMMNISEYNTTKAKNFEDDEHLYLTEAIGQMLHAQVDIASFWPMRIKQIGKSRLLDYETNKPSVIAKIHQRLAESLTGALVKSTSNDEIPSYATATDTSSTIVLTGRLIKETKNVSVKLEGDNQFGSCHIWRITGNEFTYQVKEEDILFNNYTSINISPKEVIIAEFR
ncbi:MAG: hypothetical protein WD555_05815 [Fulvivirga sp.]